MNDVIDERAVFARDYHGATTIHPLALCSLAILCILTLCLRRKHSLVPALVLVCFVPSAQRIVVAGLDFTLLRIIIGCGLCRILIRREYASVRWQTVDTVMLAWALTAFTAYVALRPQMGAAIYVLGFLTESLGLYFMFRCLIRDWSDVTAFATSLAVVAVLLGIAFMNEKATGRNVFAIFGGVKATTAVRDGRLRCMGAYSHPILAGCFWSAMFPYIAALWWTRRPNARALATVGALGAAFIVFSSSSSTPAASLLAVLLAGAWFAFRNYSRPMRYAAAGLLVALHLVMQAPVWHLIARVDLAGGSTGRHRYLLIDATIKNFSEWALLGTLGTNHWGNHLFDVTNHFIWEAVNGGLLRLLLFAAMIGMCFSRVGHITRRTSSRQGAILGWALGVALLAHCVSFLGVSYFGQTIFAWHFSLAAIVSISEHTNRARPRRVRESRQGNKMAAR